MKSKVFALCVSGVFLSIGGCMGSKYSDEENQVISALKEKFKVDVEDKMGLVSSGFNISVIENEGGKADPLYKIRYSVAVEPKGSLYIRVEDFVGKVVLEEVEGGLNKVNVYSVADSYLKKGEWIVGLGDFEFDGNPFEKGKSIELWNSELDGEKYFISGSSEFRDFKYKTYGDSVEYNAMSLNSGLSLTKAATIVQNAVGVVDYAGTIIKISKRGFPIAESVKDCITIWRAVMPTYNDVSENGNTLYRASYSGNVCTYSYEYALDKPYGEYEISYKSGEGKAYSKVL